MPFNLISFVCYWQHLWTSLFCTSFFPSIFPDVANQRRIWHDKLCTVWLECLINFSVELFTLTFKLGRSNGISALFEGTTISSETKCVCGMLYSWALSAESCLFCNRKNCRESYLNSEVFSFCRQCFSSIWTINWSRMFVLKVCQVWQFIRSCRHKNELRFFMSLETDQILLIKWPCCQLKTIGHFFF